MAPVSTTEAPAVETVIPDLSAIPVSELGKQGGPGLARAIVEYRKRLRETGVPLSSFQARI
jgi:hypothetical protein